MGNFMTEIKGTLVELAGSKKALILFIGLVSSCLTHVAGRFGWAWLDQATADAIATKIAAVASAYLVSQGIADHGKEAAVVIADKGAPK